MDPEAGEARMTHGIPVDVLEKRAEDQRLRLETRVDDLRQSVKERLDIKRNLRDHVWPAAGVVAVLGLVLGSAVVGVFTRD
jgi:ElaB/YqjD/DUF883 family membrane-anchored ribosome-binding protein